MTGNKKINFSFLYFRSSLGFGEEIIKSYFLLFYIYYSKYFTKISDGVAYGIVLALGFSFFENSMYFFKIIGQKSDIVQMIVSLSARAVGPMLMHTACTGLVGLYIGRKKFGKSGKIPLFFFILAVALLVHTTFNIFILFPKFGIFTGFFVVIAAFLFLKKEISKPEAKIVHEAIHRGLLPSKERE